MLDSAFLAARPAGLGYLQPQIRPLISTLRRSKVAFQLSSRTVRASAAAAGAARSAVIRSGIEAALDDFVSSGTNIALGGGDATSTSAIAEALAVRWETGALVDVAFRPVSVAAIAAANAFNLPTDFSVNYTPTIDLYLAHVSQMDQDLNSAMDGTNKTLGTERFAAFLATKQVLIIHEADFASTADGIMSFPILLDDMLPGRAAELVRKSQYLANAGVRDVTLRDNANGRMADILMSPGADVISIDAALRAMPGVTASGFLPSSQHVTTVVASEDVSYDITSTLASIAYLSSRPLAELKRLEGEERAKAVGRLVKGWIVTTDGPDALVRTFTFEGPDQIQAFISRVMETAALAKSFPDIQVTFNSVRVRLSTVDAHGITELDVAIAREASRMCSVLHGCRV
jgi:4a-hydroxytetrahydrobiopterin dehydratase